MRACEKHEVDHLVKSHYLGRWPGVVVLRLGLFDGEEPIGVIVFALPPRETNKRYSATMWELARLFIIDDTPKNTETWFIARAIKYIKAHRLDVDGLVSYADPSVGHSGTIYRAGNWIQDGMTDQGRKTPRCDYFVGGKKYGRKAHVPDGAVVLRVPRVSKPRFVYWMRGHERRRRFAHSTRRSVIDSTTPYRSYTSSWSTEWGEGTTLA